VLALTPKNEGDITGAEQGHLWQQDHDTPDVPSPLVVDGIAYLCRENGTLICLEALSGKGLYKERVHPFNHRSSPVYGDGKVYMTARDGTTTVVKAGPKFELLATNKLDEPMSSSPAISNGRIYMRTFKALYAIGKP
jgi:outer membrane protein assembly factor BamB